MKPWILSDLLILPTFDRVPQLIYTTCHTVWKSLLPLLKIALLHMSLYVNMAADWRSKNNAVNNRNVVSLRQNKVAPVLEGDAAFIQVTNR